MNSLYNEIVEGRFMQRFIKESELLIRVPLASNVNVNCTDRLEMLLYVKSTQILRK